MKLKFNQHAYTQNFQRVSRNSLFESAIFRGEYLPTLRNNIISYLGCITQPSQPASQASQQAIEWNITGKWFIQVKHLTFWSYVFGCCCYLTMILTLKVTFAVSFRSRYSLYSLFGALICTLLSYSVFNSFKCQK